MPVLDIIASQEEIAARQVIIEDSIGGLANMLGWQDLTEQEKEGLRPLVRKYGEWRRVFKLGEEFFAELVALGYPQLPTIEIPASILQKIDHELGQTGYARTLLLLQILATHATVTFSEPRDK